MTTKHYNPETPYNDLPLLPPMAQVENTIVLKKIISRALSELKGAITNLPSHTFIDTINLQEARQFCNRKI
jgi:hypothetical protein